MRSLVQLQPDPPITGAIAQLGERLPCTQEVGGSIPPGSTIFGEGLRPEIRILARVFISGLCDWKNAFFLHSAL